MELQGLGSENELAISTKKRSADYSTLGYLAKIGLNYEAKGLSLGLTLTSPRAHIAGSGSTNYEEFFAGIDDVKDNILESGQSTNAVAKNKSPLSIGLGAGVKFGSNTLHLSAEWFDNVDEYYVLVPEPFVGQTSGDLIRNRSIDERKSVINYGIGIEWKLKEKLKAYTSASTDFSSLVLHEDEVSGRVTDRTDNSIMTANIYHFGGGFHLT